MQNIFCLCFYLNSFFHLKPDFRYTQVGVLSDLVGVYLQLTGKISLELDFNSSLLLEYGRQWFARNS